MRIALGLLAAGPLLLATAPAAAKIANPSVWATVKGPRAKAIQRWVRKVARKKLASCARGDVMARITFTVNAKGRVQAKAAGNKQKKVRRCLAKRLRKLRLPRGKGVVKVHLRVRWLSARSLKRRALLRSKIAKVGLLKLLGSKSGKGSANIFGKSTIKGSGIGGLIGSSRGKAYGIGGLGLRGRGRGGGGVGSIRSSWKRRAKLRKKRREQAKKARKKALAKALKLPAQRGKKAPWFQPVKRSGLYSTWRPAITAGYNAALLRLVVWQLEGRKQGEEQWTKVYRRLLFDRSGLRVVVKPPVAAQWYGLDRDNKIYLASGDGQLYRAESDADAATGRFVKLAKLDKVRRWIIAGKLLAARRGKEALLSRDRGATFKPLALPAGMDTVHRLMLRPDGLLALLASDGGKKRTLHLRRGSEAWRRSSFQPPYLRQRLSTIYASHGCGRAALAADGKTWIATSRLPSTSRWGWMLHRRSFGSRGATTGGASQATPAPPVEGATVITAKAPEPCRARGGMGGLGTPGWGGGGVSATGCTRGVKQPANCVRGSADGLPRSSLFAIYPLADKRKTLLTVDHTTGALARTKLPAACKAPAALRPLSGAMLLLCREATTETRVFISDKRFRWHDQGTFAASAGELRQAQVASDGTVVLQACDYNSRRAKAEGNGYLCSTAWVRRPVALAPGAKAWREVRQRDMLAYRPLSGGRVLTIDRGDDHGTTIQLYVDDGKRAKRFGPKLKAPRNLASVIIDGRTVRLKPRYGGEQIVLRRGKLAPWPKL